MSTCSMSGGYVLITADGESTPSILRVDSIEITGPYATAYRGQCRPARADYLDPESSASLLGSGDWTLLSAELEPRRIGGVWHVPVYDELKGPYPCAATISYRPENQLEAAERLMRGRGADDDRDAPGSGACACRGCRTRGERARLKSQNDALIKQLNADLEALRARDGEIASLKAQYQAVWGERNDARRSYELALAMLADVRAEWKQAAAQLATARAVVRSMVDLAGTVPGVEGCDCRG